MFINNKKRYIEVIQCSGEDMNLVLTNGVPNGAMPPPPTVLPHGAAPMALQRPIISPGVYSGLSFSKHIDLDVCPWLLKLLISSVLHLATSYVLRPPKTWDWCFRRIDAVTPYNICHSKWAVISTAPASDTPNDCRPSPNGTRPPCWQPCHLYGFLSTSGNDWHGWYVSFLLHTS